MPASAAAASRLNAAAPQRYAPMSTQALAAQAPFFFGGRTNEAFARVYRRLRPALVSGGRLVLLGVFSLGASRAYEQEATAGWRGPLHSFAGLMTSLMPTWAEDLWRLIAIPVVTTIVIEGPMPARTKLPMGSWHELFSTRRARWQWVLAEALYFPAGLIHELGHYLAASFFFEASDGIFVMDRWWAQGELRYSSTIVKLWLDQLGVSHATADVGVRLAGFFLPVLYGFVLFHIGRRIKNFQMRYAVLMASGWVVARVFLDAADMLMAGYSSSGAMNDFPAVALLLGAHARWAMPLLYASAFGLPAWLIHRVARVTRGDLARAA